MSREVMQRALEALEYVQQDRECPSTTRQAINAIKAALAEQDEPVAWRYSVQPQVLGDACWALSETKDVPDAQPLYTRPAPQRQAEVHPVTGEQLPTSTAGWLHYVTDRTATAWQAGYAQAMKREGQRKPLPKHDQHCVDVPGYGLMAVKLVRAVERAHGIGEKND